MKIKKLIGGCLASCALAVMFLAGQAVAGYFDELEATKARAHELAEIAREEGHSEDSPDIVEAKALWNEAQAEIDHEIDMLARVIYFEAGSSWLSDRHQQLVACVLLNRCADERFPNTIEENIYRKGQYACASYLYSVTKEQIPERCYENARIALYGEVECPEGVIFQAEFKQGTGVYEKLYNTYFCFG